MKYIKYIEYILFVIPLILALSIMASCGNDRVITDGNITLNIWENISNEISTVDVVTDTNKELKLDGKNLIIDLRVSVKYDNVEKVVYDSKTDDYYISSTIYTKFVFKKNISYQVSFVVGDRLKQQEQADGTAKISNSDKKVMLGKYTYIFIRGKNGDFLLDEHTQFVQYKNYNDGDLSTDEGNDLVCYEVDREESKYYELRKIKLILWKEINCGDIIDDTWNKGEIAPGEKKIFNYTALKEGYVSWRTKGEIEPRAVIFGKIIEGGFPYYFSNPKDNQVYQIIIENNTLSTKYYEFIFSNDMQAICEQGDLIYGFNVNINFTPNKSGYYCSMNEGFFLDDKGFEYLEAGNSYKLRLYSNLPGGMKTIVGLTEISQDTVAKSIPITKNMVCKVISNSSKQLHAEIFRNGIRIPVNEYVNLQEGDLFVYYYGSTDYGINEFSFEEIDDYAVVEEDGVYERKGEMVLTKECEILTDQFNVLSAGDVIVNCKATEIKKLDQQSVSFERDCVVKVSSSEPILVQGNDGKIRYAIITYSNYVTEYVWVKKGEAILGNDLEADIQDSYYELYIDGEYVPYGGKIKVTESFYRSSHVLKVYNNGELVSEEEPEYVWGYSLVSIKLGEFNYYFYIE